MKRKMPRPLMDRGIFTCEFQALFRRKSEHLTSDLYFYFVIANIFQLKYDFFTKMDR